MLVYAWSHYRPDKLKMFGTTDYDKPVDFLSGLLCEAVRENVVHNLAQRHSFKSERMRTVRGKIDLRRSLLSPEWDAGVVVCKHPVVVVDTLENQIIKATLRQVGLLSEVSAQQRAEAKKLYTELVNVSDIALSKGLFRRALLDPSMKRYRFPLAICELLLTREMAQDSSGKSWFENYTRDEVAMRQLFEAFVREFLRHKLKGKAVVGGRKMLPYMLEMEQGSSSFVPSMRTDVTVKMESETLVIDTKYTPKALQQNFGNRTIRSEHFYQIQSYTAHASKHMKDQTVSGLVLYPKAEDELDIRFRSDGRTYGFRTLDLSQPWRSVEQDLLKLVNDSFHRREAHVVS